MGSLGRAWPGRAVREAPGQPAGSGVGGRGGVLAVAIGMVATGSVATGTVGPRRVGAPVPLPRCPSAARPGFCRPCEERVVRGPRSALPVRGDAGVPCGRGPGGLCNALLGACGGTVPSVGVFGGAGEGWVAEAVTARPPASGHESAQQMKYTGVFADENFRRRYRMLKAVAVSYSQLTPACTLIFLLYRLNYLFSCLFT